MLRKYQCHKIVEAALILDVSYRSTENVALMLEGAVGAHEEMVTYDWIRRRGNGAMPSDLVGGYFVRYPDGYTSWSPGKAFEEGYTLLNESEPAEQITSEKQAAAPKPTVGRIVHFWQFAPDAEPMPAIIVHVWSDDCVNLRIFRDSPPADDEYVTSVVRCKQGDKWGWDWPARS